MERGKHQSTGKSSHADQLVTNLLFQQNDINPCIHKRFCDNLDVEQHGDDFVVCGLPSNLELLADEFKIHFLGKKAEIVSLRPEHQNETIYSNVEFLCMVLGGMLSWIKGM